MAELVLEHNMVFIWGEAGTGKTTLAAQVVDNLDLNPPIKLRAGSTDVLRYDITAALTHAGMEPENWSDSYSRVQLRRLLESDSNRGANVVILDNLDDETLLDELIPSSPQVPVLVTTRTRPSKPGAAALELGDFTECEALEFIGAILPDIATSEARSLAEALGCRPLALEHAVRFIHESPDISATYLAHLLRLDVTDGLDTVSYTVDNRRNLILLYKQTLAELGTDSNSMQVLDHFLAIAGRGGYAFTDILYSFMESVCELDRLHFRSALRSLSSLGFIREDDLLLNMHPLTCEVLRDLRAAITYQIEDVFLQYMGSQPLDLPENQDGFTLGDYYAWFLGRAMQLSKSILPPGWELLQPIDDNTIIAVRTSMNAHGQSERYTLRYELDSALTYVSDYRTGKRRLCSEEEVSELGDLLDRYNDFFPQIEQWSAPWASEED